MSRMGDLAATDVYNAFDVPLEQTYDRRLDQTWPGQLVQDAMGAVLAPGRALQSTEPITTEQMIKPAMDLAGLVTGGSYAAPAQRGASGAGIRAYHGSPYDFEKFDISKIGTGEGAQAYGHGLYFAGNEDVARGYRDALRSKVLINPTADMIDPQRIAAELFDSYRGQNLKDALSDAKFYDNGAAVAAELRRIYANPPMGHMYEVNINADPAHMLDWDKAFKEQSSHVQNVLRDDLYLAPIEKETGRELYRQAYPLIDDLDVGRVRATERLRGAGIPGIKYLDEGSRGVPTVGTGRVQAAGPGKFNIVDDFGIQAGPFPTLEQAQQYLNPGKKLTSNYVIFDPNIIRIDKKYVVPGAAAGMGALAAQDQYRE